MSGIINKVKEALHSDKTHETSSTSTSTHPTSTHNTTSTTHPTSTTHNTTGAGLSGTGATTGSTNHGPHDSNLANKADPRIDSDLDGRATHTGTGVTGTHGTSHNTTTGSGLTGTHGTTHNTTTGSGLAGTHGTTHNTTTGSGLAGTHSTTHNTTGAGLSGTGTAAGSTNHGPHDSNLANKADPRIDSDLDGRATHTGTGVTGTHGTTHNTTTGSGLTGTHGTHTTGSGLAGTHGSHNTAGSGLTGTHNTSTNHGPHDSNVANKADPRIDSDLDGRATHTGTRVTGTHGTSHNTTTGSGLTGTHGTHNTGSGLTGAHGTHNTTGGELGPHSTATANQLDPTVGNRGAGYGNEHVGSNVGNPKSTNAGPYSSNVLNSIDPRVDSDLDGSKTVGGNKTYSSGKATHSATGRDPTDSAQVPPSVLAAHQGQPIVAHDHASANHAGRHGSLSHQEAQSGI